MAARGPSAHFTWAELGSPPAAHRERAVHLARHLEQLRSICGGRPLRIVSGFRSTEKNAAVGGEARSQHLYGRAADIPRGYATTGQAEKAGFTGIGSQGPWAIHVDVRTGPQARWTYPG
jgi:zinc D-Ala-D-Ala carboxypeptidase